jgi:hypothetical protein
MEDDQGEVEQVGIELARAMVKISLSKWHLCACGVEVRPLPILTPNRVLAQEKGTICCRLVTASLLPVQCSATRPVLRLGIGYVSENVRGTAETIHAQKNNVLHPLEPFAKALGVVW